MEIEYRDRTFLIIYFSHSVSPPNNTIRIHYYCFNEFKFKKNGNYRNRHQDNNNANRDTAPDILYSDGGGTGDWDWDWGRKC